MTVLAAVRFIPRPPGLDGFINLTGFLRFQSSIPSIPQLTSSCRENEYEDAVVSVELVNKGPSFLNNESGRHLCIEKLATFLLCIRRNPIFLHGALDLQGSKCGDTEL